MPMFLSIYCKQCSKVLCILCKIFEFHLFHILTDLWYYLSVTLTIYLGTTLYFSSFTNILGSSEFKTSVFEWSLSKEKKHPWNGRVCKSHI